ncbi:hypothetical protein UBN26_13540 [Helicobacter pylori]
METYIIDADNIDGDLFSIILLETAMIFPCCPFLNSITLPKKLEIFLKNMAKS